MAPRSVAGEHVVIHKRAGRYTGPSPVLELLPDGRLAAGTQSSPWAEHVFLGEWVVKTSADGGRTWVEDSDPSLPLNWPGSTVRERGDRLTVVVPDGTWLATGALSWEVWPASRRTEAEALRLRVRPHQGGDDQIVVGSRRLFAQHSTDQGNTWSRREWTVPECGVLIGFPRGLLLGDGRTLLYPVREHGHDEFLRQGHAWRSTDAGQTWGLRAFPAGVYQRMGNEAAFIETEPGRVLALMRDMGGGAGEGFLMEMRSDDAGASWSRPVQLPIWGYPPQLLRLRDGRILCSYGYRREPMGIRACLSEDNGRTWLIQDELVLRDDGGAASELRPDRHTTGSYGGDLGYPTTCQLPDGSLFTAYYFTGADRVTHLSGTRWSL
ncbi:MAG: sialidase family protein [Chloroflexota bacterium]